MIWTFFAIASPRIAKNFVKLNIGAFVSNLLAITPGRTE